MPPDHSRLAMHPGGLPKCALSSSEGVLPHLEQVVGIAPLSSEPVLSRFNFINPNHLRAAPLQTLIPILGAG